MSSLEISRLGSQPHVESIRREVEALEIRVRPVVFDVDHSGVAARRRMLARSPNAVLHCFRIGCSAAYGLEEGSKRTA